MPGFTLTAISSFLPPSCPRIAEEQRRKIIELLVKLEQAQDALRLRG